MNNLFKVVFMIAFLWIMPFLSFADIIASYPKINEQARKKVELGAEVKITFKLKNNSEQKVKLSAIPLELSFDPLLIDRIAEVKNLSPGRFKQERGEINPGTLDFNFSAVPEIMLGPGEEIDIADVYFHISQNALIPVNRFVVFFGPVEKQVKAIQLVSSPNIFNLKIPACMLEASLAPEFKGLSSARSENNIGNTVLVEWITPANAAADLTPFVGNKLNYKIFRSTSELMKEDRVEWFDESLKPYTGNLDVPYTLRDGPATGIPGDEYPLSDGTTYYYKVTAQDNCSPLANEQANTRVLAVTPLDLTAPPDVVDFTAEATSQGMVLKWKWQEPKVADLGGVVIVRNIGKPVGAGYLEGPVASGSTYKNGKQYETGQKPFGWQGGEVIFSGEQDTYIDPDIENDTAYFYKIFCFDQAVDTWPKQLGRNYSPGKSASAFYCRSIAGANNFMVFPSGTDDQVILYWQNPDDINYDGSIIVYSNDPDKRWDSISIKNGKINGDVALVAPKTSGPGGDETISLDIDPAKKYYFAIFPYSNNGKELNPYSQEELKRSLIANPSFAALNEELGPKIRIYINDTLYEAKPIVLDPQAKVLVVYEEIPPYGVKIKPAILDEGSPASQILDLSAKESTAVAYGENNQPIISKSIIVDIPSNISDKHVITFHAESAGEIGKAADASQSLVFEIIGGPLRIDDTPLAFPSPFSIARDKQAIIQYKLSQDANIDLYIVNLSGQRVKHFVLNKGEEGGRAGTNKVLWNGGSAFGGSCANGIYIGTIIAREENRLLGKFKLTIVN